jgi:hypothetical protein
MMSRLTCDIGVKGRKGGGGNNAEGASSLTYSYIEILSGCRASNVHILLS